MLTDERIKNLWKTFEKHDWSKWQKDYLEFLIWARNISDSELRSEAAQRKLWNTRAITPVGYGDAIDIGPLLADSRVVDAIIALRKRTWPNDTDKRGESIQQEYGRIESIAVALKVKPTPHAKLHRLMVALAPEELTCVLNYQANRHVAKLLLGNGEDPLLSGQVKMRARLRTALGKEKDLAEHVRRSTFCWRLHELYDHLTAENPVSGPNEAAIHTTSQPNDNTSKPTDLLAKPIEIWPFAKQFMGNFAIRSLGAAYRAVIQAALPGLSRDDLVGVLQSMGDFENFSAQSLRLLVIRIKGLGFIQERDGLLFPTAQGEELLGSGEFGILIERFIERIFGFPQLLKHIADHPGQTDEQMVTALQSLYPNWTTSRMPNDLRNWTLYLDLVERDAHGGLVLTEYGKGWVDRFPKELPKPPVDETIAAEFTKKSLETSSVPYPTFDAILAKFKSDPEIADFVFDERQLATLHTAWRSHPRKRFVLLSGLSGTGKTAITLCYSKAVCELMGLPVSDHREVVPVSPDWRDPSGLLGYFNALHADPTFQAEPALRLVLRAVEDPRRPYFLILDEMNLARVERYFAPFLSAMETGKDLVLHANSAEVNDVPPRVPWPTNLHIAGTVNMDETTHAFSDKVLDRAFTLEFWDVDLATYFERAADKGPDKRLPDVEAVLSELHEAMRPIRRHFGYRTANEVIAFMRAIPTLEGTTSAGFLDQAVFAKVLPRLRGEDSPACRHALETLIKICKQRSLMRSETKLVGMLEQLKRTGITRFWA